MKIERELYIKSILDYVFGYTGVYPYSSTYKQLNTISKFIFKIPIYKKEIDDQVVDILLHESTKRNFGYAEFFLRKLKIRMYNFDLPPSIKTRIGFLDIDKQKYIFNVLKTYDEITSDNIPFIFNNEFINFYTASVLIDIYIEDITDIHNITQIFSEMEIQDKEMIVDYICDYISEFSRRDSISDWNLNNKLTDKIMDLNAFDFFMVQFHIHKTYDNITNGTKWVNTNVKDIISDILIENADRPFKKMKIVN